MQTKYCLLAVLVLIFVSLPVKVLAENTSDVYGSDIESRLGQAVANQKLVLDDAAKQSIANKCQDAQIILRDVQLNADRATRRRITVYTSIQKDLQSIKFRMARQGSDASETDLLYGKLQQLIDQITVQADKYGTTLDDITTVNCQQKPEYFKAGLVLARAQQARLLDIALRVDLAVEDDTTFGQLKKRLVL